MAEGTMKRTDIARDPGMAARLAETLRQRGPLADLSAESAAEFLRHGALLELAPGEALIREDEAATAEIYLLVEGTLLVRAKSGTLARLNHPGDVVGETAVLLSTKRTADVIAETAVRVVAIPSKVLGMPEYAQVEAGVSGAMIRDDWVKY
jgi:CRP-like cAMP-binding protein